MITQWVNANRIVNFDATDNSVTLTTLAGEYFEGPRPATDEELQQYASRYQAEPTFDLNVAVRAQLASTLNSLREITQDNNITSQEISQSLPSVFGALYAFRDMLDPDEQTIKLALLLVSQIALAEFAMLSAVNQQLSGLYSSYLALSNSLDAALDRIDALEGA